MNSRKEADRLGRARTNLTLFTSHGERKYLNTAERQRFIMAAERAELRTRLLCLTLVYTGCRLSEALALTRHSVTMVEHCVLIQSLKKRGTISFRRVPVPEHYLREMQTFATGTCDASLFGWRRTAAWHAVKTVLADTGIKGACATPRGLRHTFGTHAVASGIPLNLVQRWLGHARLETTAIYADVQGSEEVEIARRMWGTAQSRY